MPRYELEHDRERDGLDADWYGNNAAFRCPYCHKVFIVSAHMDKNNGFKRPCPNCQRSTGYCNEGLKKGGTASIEW